MKTMYDGKINSPRTQLDGAITINATSMTLVDASVLPTAPNICTIGNGNDAETVTYSDITGNVVTIARAFEGVAKAWDSGTVVSRNFTHYDYDALKDNVDELETNQGDLTTLTTTEKTSLVGAVNEVDAELATHKAENVTVGNPHGIDAKANKVQESWITPTLLNGWAAVTGDSSPISYRKNQFNQLEFKGTIGSGLENTIAFQLPVGYRPAQTRYVVTVSTISFGIVYIQSDGNVLIRIKGAGSTRVSFDNIRVEMV